MNNLFNRKEITRFITGECSAEERRRIEAWMREDPKNKELVKEYQKTWKLSEQLALEQNKDVTWQKLLQNISHAEHLVSVRELHQKSENTGTQKTSMQSSGYFKKSGHQSWLLQVAAAVFLVLCVSSLLYIYTDNTIEQKTQIEMKEVSADRGEHLHVSFSDGSSVVLNSSSVIRFPKEFNGDQRRVELDGEAFFSVAERKEQPFLVQTNGAVVQVKGTKFNVNGYSSDDKVEVVVADGEVAVRSKSENSTIQSNEVMLEREEYTVVKKGMAPTVPEKVSLDPYIGWINGRLIFEATPLDVVLNRLELYYGQDFKISDSDLLNRRLTASFDKESLSKVLEVLSVSMDLEYEQRDSLIFLKAI